MNKLYFYYGAMGSSKTAQALMCKFNYEQKGFNVFLFKPIVDNRTVTNGKSVVGSRIGLQSPCYEFDTFDNFFDICEKYNIIENAKNNVIIIDECQFLTAKQVDELKLISFNMPILCYGLLTNFKTQLFEGSKRLVEIADKLSEIKSVCACGRKATVNARIIDGKVCTDGNEVNIGGDESYQSMCYHCYYKKVKNQSLGKNKNNLDFIE